VIAGVKGQTNASSSQSFCGVASKIWATLFVVIAIPLP